MERFAERNNTEFSNHCFVLAHAFCGFGSRVYDLHQLEEIRTIEAHESDVVCLEYSFSKAGEQGVCFVCLFDGENAF